MSGGWIAPWCFGTARSVCYVLENSRAKCGNKCNYSSYPIDRNQIARGWGGVVRAWTAPTVNTARGPCTVTIDVCRVAYSISQPIPGLPIVRWLIGKSSFWNKYLNKLRVFESGCCLNLWILEQSLKCVIIQCVFRRQHVVFMSATDSLICFKGIVYRSFRSTWMCRPALCRYVKADGAYSDRSACSLYQIRHLE